MWRDSCWLSWLEVRHNYKRVKWRNVAYNYLGLFSDLKFAYAQFPVSSVCGDQLFEPFWNAVSRLE